MSSTLSGMYLSCILSVVQLLVPVVETVKALYPYGDPYGELYHEEDEEVLTADREARAAVRLLIFGLEELLNIKKNRDVVEVLWLGQRPIHALNKRTSFI